MKEELEQFNIDMDTIRPTNEFFENLQEAIEEMRKNTLKDRFEVILNNNLINCVEIKNNFRTILGCRVSFENLDRNISFIVKEDLKPSYEKLEQEIKRLLNIIDELEHKLYQEWLEWKDSDCESIYVRAFEDKAIYDYIQELKGDNENGK